MKKIMMMSSILIALLCLAACNNTGHNEQSQSEQDKIEASLTTPAQKQE